MLKKINRLSPTERSSQAKQFTTPYIRLAVWQSGQKVSRFGFVVTKRIDKRATKRNYYRRILQRAIEVRLARLSGGVNCLLFLRRVPQSDVQSSLDQAVQTVLIHAGIMGKTGNS